MLSKIYQLTLLEVESKKTFTRKFRFTAEQLILAQKQRDENTVITSPGSKGYTIKDIEEL